MKHRLYWSGLLTALVVVAPITRLFADETARVGSDIRQPPVPGNNDSSTVNYGTLKEGTEVTVKLVHDTYTNNIGQGAPVLFNVADNIFTTDGAHGVAICQGAIAMGRIISHSKDFNHGVSGKLTFTCEYALGVESKRVYLRATPLRSGAVKIEIQAKHSSTVIQLEKSIMRRAVGYPAGSEFLVYVDQDIKIPINSATQPAMAPPAPNSPVIIQAPAAAPAPAYTAPAPAPLPVAPKLAPAPLPVAPKPAPTPSAAAAPKPASAPSAAAAPVELSIVGIPCRVRVETKDGNSYIGDVTKVDGDVYTIETHQGTVKVGKSDLKLVEYVKL